MALHHSWLVGASFENREQAHRASINQQNRYNKNHNFGKKLIAGTHNTGYPVAEDRYRKHYGKCSQSKSKH
jgi:predicted alpha-1,6-mannanase (GH76 family)